MQPPHSEFLIYEENLLLFFSYLRISSYIRKPFLIYDFATAPLWTSFYMGKILFFYQCTTPHWKCTVILQITKPLPSYLLYSHQRRCSKRPIRKLVVSGSYKYKYDVSCNFSLIFSGLPPGCPDENWTQRAWTISIYLCNSWCLVTFTKQLVLKFADARCTND